MRHNRQYGQKSAIVREEENRSRSISRHTQLQLQADFCRDVLGGTSREEYPEVHAVIDAAAFDSSDEGRRDRAWLRYHR